MILLKGIGIFLSIFIMIYLCIFFLSIITMHFVKDIKNTIERKKEEELYKPATKPKKEVEIKAKYNTSLGIWEEE